MEELTREAFWNKHDPGCDEHYLVHVMRNHPDFLPDLDFVATRGDKIVGNIMYTKSRLINENSLTIEASTFGPVSVLPKYQKKGIGTALIQHSMKEADSARKLVKKFPLSAPLESKLMFLPDIEL